MRVKKISINGSYMKINETGEILQVINPTPSLPIAYVKGENFSCWVGMEDLVTDTIPERRIQICPTCKGFGYVNSNPDETCEKCNGDAVVAI